MSEKDSNDELSDISSGSESSDNDSIPDTGLLKPYDHDTSHEEQILIKDRYQTTVQLVV